MFVIARSMSSNEELSDPTRAFLTEHSLRAASLWFLSETEVVNLESQHPGLRDAWLEITRRARPAPSSVGYIFGRTRHAAERPPEEASSAAVEAARP